MFSLHRPAGCSAVVGHIISKPPHIQQNMRHSTGAGYAPEARRIASPEQVRAGSDFQQPANARLSGIGAGGFTYERVCHNRHQGYCPRRQAATSLK